MDWTAATIAKLRALWDEGHATNEIGRRMGITKNAVVGKAHRLMLPARPSPIRPRQDGDPPPKRIRRAPAQTLPVVKIVAPVVVPPPAPPPPPVMLFKPRVATACCWPEGEPGKAGFRFCGERSVPGRPYCESHTKRAYQPRPAKADAYA